MSTELGQAQNTRSWANMANENDALRASLPEGPPSAAATYKAKTYLPDAPRWAARQETIAEEASAERANTPTPLRESNLENLGINKYSYNRQRERMGLRPRPNRTPSRERRARTYRARRRSPSPNRRGSRRYGVGSRYVAAPGFGSRRRSRSGSPRRRSPSPRRRSPSPRYSRRRSPSVNEFGRNMTRNYRPRRVSPRGSSPLRYTVAANGRTVNEFGRNVSRTERRWPRSNGTRGRRRPIHVFDEKTKTYKPADWNI